MSDDIVFKKAVSVTEMAAMVGLSRARFYQLQQAGTFPPPEYQAETGRPFYSEKGQQICLAVRQRNQGVDGQAVLFYEKRRKYPTSSSKARPTKSVHAKKIPCGLKALGLATVTADQVNAVLQKSYPAGLDGVDTGQVLRDIFLQIHHSGDCI